MAAKNDITADRVRELLEYDPATGLFEWRVARANVKVGQRTGCLNSGGYRYIGIDNRLYKAHRLAWLYVYGRWPANDIDHINGVRDDNRIANLREATRSQNIANARGTRKNKSGFKGAYFLKRERKWLACITVCGKRQHIGLFTTAAGAHAAYVKAAKHHFGEFARTE